MTIRLDPLPYVNRVTGTRYPDLDTAYYFTFQRSEGDLYEFLPGPGYSQNREDYA